MSNFNKKEKFKLAEFIYALKGDTLMKSEALDAIHVLSNHWLIKNTSQWVKRVEDNDDSVAFDVHMEIKKVMDPIDINKMMEDYFSGKLQ